MVKLTCVARRAAVWGEIRETDGFFVKPSHKMLLFILSPRIQLDCPEVRG